MPLQQDIHENMYAEFPDFATYDGDDATLAHLKGKWFRMRDAARLIPVGERENIYATRANGRVVRPWMNVPIYEVDADGHVIDTWHSGGTAGAENVGGMASGDLAALGWTDADLDGISREVLGKPWEPDRPGPSLARKARYEEVLKKAYA